MELETVFLDSKWLIITALSHKKMSPTQLAEETGTSAANISTQLRLLEALDFVKQERLNNVGKGEPRKLYSLKKNFVYLILGSRATVGKKLFKLKDEDQLFFSSWMISDQIHPYVLLKFYLDHEVKLAKAESIGFLDLNGNEVELLVIHPNPEILYPLNDVVIERGKQYKFKIHVHKKEDFLEGIEKGEDYFKDIVKKVIILHDKNELISSVKKGKK